MAKRCIGCKREIASDQKSCYLCGCSQSFLRYHLKSGVVLLGVMAIFASASYWYIDKTIKAIEMDKALLAESKNESAALQINQVELELTQLKSQLLASEEKLTIANDENSQLKIQLEQATLKISEAENKVIETDKKAGWLLKLNRQLKEQVASLSGKSSDVQEETLVNEQAP